MPESPLPPPPAVCTDIQPSGNYTCAEQLAWGKCEYVAMAMMFVGLKN